MPSSTLTSYALFYPYIICPLLPSHHMPSSTLFYPYKRVPPMQSLPSFLRTSTNKFPPPPVSSAALVYATLLAQACSGVRTLIPSFTLTHALFYPYIICPLLPLHHMLSSTHTSCALFYPYIICPLLPIQHMPSFTLTSYIICLLLPSHHALFYPYIICPPAVDPLRSGPAPICPDRGRHAPESRACPNRGARGRYR